MFGQLSFFQCMSVFAIPELMFDGVVFFIHTHTIRGCIGTFCKSRLWPPAAGPLPQILQHCLRRASCLGMVWTLALRVLSFGGGCGAVA